MKIIFWNTNKNGQLSTEFELLASEVKPDIILLAESQMTPSAILQSLNKTSTAYFFNPEPAPICDKILMFSKFQNISAVTSEPRFTVRKIDIPNYPIFNLMALHYQSKVNWSAADQAAHAIELNQRIQDFERQTQQPNTLLIGDFNMNPFEAGMVQITGLHAVMSKEVALKMTRKVGDKEYAFFYNPMWSFFGDMGKGEVNGTAYYAMSNPINYFWNIFDQVLLRPTLIPYLDEENLEIITKLGNEKSLLTKNKTVDTKISDHLPISVTIKPLSI